MDKEFAMDVKTPEEIERYEDIKHYVEEDLANYHTYVNNMKSLQDRILKLKAEYEIQANDIIESIAYSANMKDSDAELMNSDKTPLVALEYEKRQKNMIMELHRNMCVEYMLLQRKIWFIEHSITALPAEQFEIINCLILNGWTYEATAAELSCGKKKISTLKKAAIESLFKIYEKYYPDYTQIA